YRLLPLPSLPRLPYTPLFRSVQGACYEPTLLTDVPADVAMSKEETFGPVATITVVDDADEAVSVANQTTYGLSAGILTRDADRGDRKSTRLNSSHGSISYAVF